MVSFFYVPFENIRSDISLVPHDISTMYYRCSCLCFRIKGMVKLEDHASRYKYKNMNTI